MTAKEYLLSHWIKNEVWTHLKWPKHQKRLRTCASLLEGDTFVDVGCALGHSTSIMKKFKNGKWSGIEFANPQVVIKDPIEMFGELINVAQLLFPEISFYYCPEETYDMFQETDLQWDGVVCSEVIEHVERKVLLLKKLFEITKKVLVLTTPNVRVSDPGHLIVYTEEMLVSLLNHLKMRKYKIIKQDTFWYIVIWK